MTTYDATIIMIFIVVIVVIPMGIKLVYSL